MKNKFHTNLFFSIMKMDFLQLDPIDLRLPEEIVVQKFTKQMTTLGFIYIKNVDGFDEEKMLSACQKFHNIPEEEKRKLMCKNHNPENKNIYRGLSPFIDNDESHKELFDMGLPLEDISKEEKIYPLHEETPFPTNNIDYDELHQFYHKQLKHRLDLGLKLASYIALGLGLDRNYFEKFFTNSLSTFRTIYYKPRCTSPVKQDLLSEDSLKLTTPAHTDSGFMTILSTLGYEGLQVLHEGKYKSIKPKKNHFIVNFGDMLSKITNNKVKATKHRVIDIGIERYSNPFFFDPNYSAKIPNNITNSNDNLSNDNLSNDNLSNDNLSNDNLSNENLSNDNLSNGKEYIIYGEYLIEKIISKYGEWKNFKLPKN